MRPSAGHVPLRIQWELATPWHPPALGLHLDGLLAHAVVQRKMADLDATDESQAKLTFADLIRDLPLSRFETDGGTQGDRWVWMASLLQGDVVGSERRYMTTKTPVQSIADLTAEGLLSKKGGSKVDTVRGPYKAGSMHITLQHVKTLTAWCVGDPDQIADLLGDIHALGGKTRLGHGRILEKAGQLFTMDEDAEAFEHWKRRLMPIEMPGYASVIAPLRSPYWARDTAVPAWAPVS